jgi:hypothetical protein
MTTEKEKNRFSIYFFEASEKKIRNEYIENRFFSFSVIITNSVIC